MNTKSDAGQAINQLTALRALASTRYLLGKLSRRHVWGRIMMERLTEPVHLNALSLAVWLFGSYESKIAFDLVLRPQHAYGIMRAARTARDLGLRKVALVEFGVAGGAGLMNMAYIARRVTRETGVAFRIYGFDSGSGMPPPQDYRDHPEYYKAGDFPMDEAALRDALPETVTLLLGDLGETVPAFLADRRPDEPIGFVAVDVDYYWSTHLALQVFLADDPADYLPLTTVYFDDIMLDHHNSWAGELLAIREFNERSRLRKLERHRFLENRRVFRNALWLKQTYFLHVMDHPARGVEAASSGDRRVLDNGYLRRSWANLASVPNTESRAPADTASSTNS